MMMMKKKKKRRNRNAKILFPNIPERMNNDFPFFVIEDAIIVVTRISNALRLIERSHKDFLINALFLGLIFHVASTFAIFWCQRNEHF